MTLELGWGRVEAWFLGSLDRGASVEERLDRHVRAGARAIGVVLAGSLVLLHLPTILFTHDAVSVPHVLVVGATGLFIAVVVASSWLRPPRGGGEPLAVLVSAAGAFTLFASAILDQPSEDRITPEVFLTPLPVILLSMAAWSPVRAGTALLLGGAIAGVQAAAWLGGWVGGTRAFHVFALTFTINAAVASALLCHLRRRTLIQLYARETELRATNERLAELLESLRRTQQFLVASERTATLGRVGAGLAHELKTPLAAASNGVLLLRDLVEELRGSIGREEVDDADLVSIADELGSAVQTVDWSCRAATRQVNAIGRHARLRYDRSVSPFHPTEELRRVEELFSHRIREARASVACMGDADVRLVGSPREFTQLCAELLEHAIARVEGDRGGVVRCCVKPDGPDVTLRVTARGGRPEPRAADPDGSLDELRLYVARDLAESSFGGKLTVVEAEACITYEARFPRRPNDRPPRLAPVGSSGRPGRG